VFNKWRKKLLNLFTEEVDNQDTEKKQNTEPKSRINTHSTSTSNSNMDLETKMTYQYPKSNISKSSSQLGHSRPKRKQEESAEDKDVTNESGYNPGKKREKTSGKDVNKKRDDLFSSKKVVKNNNKPFEPTEVPSPVYGFQKRKQASDIAEVPVFEREEERKDHDDNDKKRIDRGEEENKQTNEISLEQKRREMEAAKSEEEKETKDVAENEPDQALNETAAANEKIVSENKDSAERKKPKKTEKNNNQSEANPYNVIMTPSDKQRLNQKQVKKQQSNKHIVSQYISREKKPESKKKTNNQTVQAEEVTLKDNLSAENEKKAISIPDYLLDDTKSENKEDDGWVREQQGMLEETLKHFNVKASVVKATKGPSVTRFEVHPEMGVKVSKIKNLSDDLKLNMAAEDIRIEAPIPGKNTVGIEVPNQNAEMVGLGSILAAKEFKESESLLSIALGVSIEGKPKISNIQKMPHGLIAGATGSGKSVCINTILISLMYKASPDDVKFLLIDPKMVELAPYNGIPYLVSPVITDVKAATQSLKWAVGEMENRYNKFVHEGVRDMERYNRKMKNEGRSDEKLAYLVIVIDELADLMMMAPQEVEDSISRIAQKARACGIHLLLATQRPSVDVITGLIKANIPTRIAFSVSQQVDSRTIIDASGAEKLLGNGDMLFAENGAGKTIRLQGPFVSDEEIDRVTNYARTIAPPEYLFEQEQLLEQLHQSEEEDEDELVQEAIEFVLEQNSASTSLLQRHFRIGYNRAARLMDSLENKGIISEANGSKAREILVTHQQTEEI